MSFKIIETSFLFIVVYVKYLFSVCFKVFDLDRDGYLSESEIKHMVTVLLHVRNENHTMTPKLGKI